MSVEGLHHKVIKPEVLYLDIPQDNVRIKLILYTEVL